MVFNCFSEVKREFVDDADYYKVTLVTSQAYQDGFTALYALKCDEKEKEILAKMNEFKSLYPEMQSPVITHTSGPSGASGDIKEELSVTVDYPEECVEIKDPTGGMLARSRMTRGRL